MSQEKEKDSPEVPKEDNRNKADLWAGRMIVAIGVIVMMFILSFCTGMCSSGSSYDDRWDRLEHSVKSDPYYRQW